MKNPKNQLIMFVDSLLIIFIILSLCVATSCVNNKTEKAQEINKNIMDNKSILRNAFQKVFNQKNTEEIDKLFRKDYVCHHPLAPIHGIEAVKMQVIYAHKALSGFHIDVHEIISEKNMVVSRFTANGKHVANFMDIPATGNSLKITAIIISRIEAGKIAEEWEFADLIGVQQQLGAINSKLNSIIPIRTKPEDFTWGQPLSTKTYPGSSETNKAKVRKAVDNLFNKKIKASFSHYFSKDFILHVPSLPNVKNLQELEKYLEKIGQATQNLYVSINDLIAERDLVAIRYSSQFIHSISDKQISTQGIAIFKLNEGKIMECWLCTDLIGISQQIDILSLK